MTNIQVERACQCRSRRGLGTSIPLQYWAQTAQHEVKGILGDRCSTCDAETYASPERLLCLVEDELIPDGTVTTPGFDILDFRLHGCLEQLRLRASHFPFHSIPDVLEHLGHSCKERGFHIAQVWQEILGAIGGEEQMSAYTKQTIAVLSLEDVSQREVGKVDIGLRDGNGRRQPCHGHCGHHILVREHHTLGHPCCTAGVHDRNHVSVLGWSWLDHNRCSCYCLLKVDNSDAPTQQGLLRCLICLTKTHHRPHIRALVAFVDRVIQDVRHAFEGLLLTNHGHGTGVRNDVACCIWAKSVVDRYRGPIVDATRNVSNQPLRAIA
mmetsp:Transcript_4951/g.8686  ORF Transcript_4951/g.8686 Transcript_4951/m.8686 type:complete len:324 (-) Transcript_4951:621-1592(-)